MDKQTESREQFEKWFSDKYPLKKPSVRKLKLWQAWEACLDSLVVELPDELRVESIIDKNVQQAFVNGHLLGRKECSDAIRAIGIRIKGEGV
jgi:hypothetical protein